MLRYAGGLESGAVSIDEQVLEIDEESEEVHLVKLGWALKGASTSKRRFSEKQKKYLTALFLLGEQPEEKQMPVEVSKSMIKARNADGSLIFLSDEYLTSQQITSFFSRMPAKKFIQLPSASNLDDDDDDDDLLSALAEREFDQMRQEIVDKISIQHPIICESYESAKWPPCPSFQSFQ